MIFPSFHDKKFHLTWTRTQVFWTSWDWLYNCHSGKDWKHLEKFIRKKRKMWSNSSSYLVFRSLRRKSSTQLASLKRNKTGAKRVDEVTNNSSISSTALEEPIKVSQTIFPTFSESNEVSFATKRSRSTWRRFNWTSRLYKTNVFFFLACCCCWTAATDGLNNDECCCWSCS